MGRVGIVFAFFLLLTISAATGFPTSVYGEDLPRGLRALDWIVSNLATDHLGRAGGAALFGILGVAVTALVLRQSLPTNGRPKREPPPAPDPREAAAPAARRRVLVAGKGEGLGPAETGDGTATKGSIEVLRGADPGSTAAHDQRPAESHDYARLLARIVEDNAPPVPPEGPLPADIVAASRHPIVFRQIVPPPTKPGLSFYGGRPVAPAGLEWPRSGAAKPFHFIMQWDCRELAAQDRTGLLPGDGVLYFFLDFEWGRDDGFRFIHVPGPADGWVPVSAPNDLGPVHGDQGAWQMAGCTSKVDNANDYVPRLMPHFPFTPVSFEYPAATVDEANDEDGAERLFWSDGAACGEALLAVQKADGAATEMRDLSAPPRAFERPFAAFPHDFGAVRVLAATAIKELDGTYLIERRGVLPELSEEEKRTLLAEWLQQARELYLFACEQETGTPVAADVADQIWDWTAGLEPVFRLGFERVVIASVDLSLGVGSAALDAVPSEWLAEAARLHALASEHLHDEHPDWSQPDAAKRHEEKKARGELKKVRAVHAPTPTHMLGPPSYVQGYVEELMDEHVLLLEVTSGSGPAHHFGDGVLQYLIAPDDLRKGRFDQVKAVISGY